MTDRPLTEKKESRCVHLVGGRQCRIPANWLNTCVFCGEYPVNGGTGGA